MNACNILNSTTIYLLQDIIKEKIEIHVIFEYDLQKI